MGLVFGGCLDKRGFEDVRVGRFLEVISFKFLVLRGGAVCLGEGIEWSERGGVRFSVIRGDFFEEVTVELIYVRL